MICMFINELVNPQWMFGFWGRAHSSGPRAAQSDARKSAPKTAQTRDAAELADATWPREQQPSIRARAQQIMI